MKKNNQNRIGTTAVKEPKSFAEMLVKFIEAYKKFWLISIITMLLGAAIGWVYYSKSYVVDYESKATFSITAPDYSGSTNKSYSNNSQLAEDLSVSFNYLINNEVFYEVIQKDLGTSSVPGTITITTVENTNIISIVVNGTDPKMVYKVLKSVLKNYASVTDFVVGDTKLTVLEEPTIPKSPNNPYNPFKMVLAFALIGFFVGCIPPAVYSLVIKTIKSRGDVEKYLNTPYLGNLPAIVLDANNELMYKEAELREKNNLNNNSKKEKKKAQKEIKKKLKKNKKKELEGTEKYCSIINKNVGFRYVEAFRSIASRCEREFIKNNSRVIVITSTKSGEGKSTFSMNLAYALSKNQKKVMLMDGDLRKPSLKEMVGAKTPSYSIASFLSGEIRSSKAITNLEGTRVLALTPDTPSDNPVDTINSDAMTNFIKEVKQVVDYIIIDAPPCSGLSDAAALAKHGDGVIYVVKEDEVRVNKILDTMQEFSYTKKPILGCVINGSVGKINLAYGYGSHYGYGKYGYGRYGYGYGGRRYGYGYGQYGRYGYGYGAYGSYGDVSDREFKSTAHTVTKKIKMSTTDEERQALEIEREKLQKEEEESQNKE